MIFDVIKATLSAELARPFELTWWCQYTLLSQLHVCTLPERDDRDFI